MIIIKAGNLAILEIVSFLTLTYGNQIKPQSIVKNTTFVSSYPLILKTKQLLTIEVFNELSHFHIFLHMDVLEFFNFK